MSAEVSLDGKVAVVTGAAGGIGSATARVLAAAGARVVLADLPETMLASVAATVEGECAHHEVDIADEASVQSLMDFTVDTYGRLDIVDNNAALTSIAEDRDLLSLDVGIWDKAMRTNARGTMLMCKHAVPRMTPGGGGSIVNISSGTATAGDFFATAYACSKGAINTLTKYVATQCADQGIRCNAIAPGLVLTPSLEAGMPVAMRDAMVRAGKLVPRLGDPIDIANAVLFLASDLSSWITGQVFPVDGGFFAHLPTTDAVRQLMAAHH